MNRLPTIEQEMTALEAQLKALYKDLSDQYKRMAAVRDEFRLNAMQGSADSTLQQTIDVRGKLIAKRREWAKQWNEGKQGTSPVRGQ